MTLIAISSLALFKSSIAAFKSSLASEYWLDNCKRVNIGTFVPKLKLVLALLMSLYELSIGEAVRPQLQFWLALPLRFGRRAHLVVFTLTLPASTLLAD